MEDTAVKDNDHDLERRKEERRKGAADLGDALNRINLIINSTFNYEKIMDSVVVEAAKAIGCEASSVALREGANWIIRHVHGMAREWLGRSFSDKEAPHALFAEVSKRPVAINDAFTDKRTNNEVMRAMGVRSVLVIPLLPRGKIRETSSSPTTPLRSSSATPRSILRTSWALRSPSPSTTPLSTKS
ncbi:MAG: GAF domain-containing protein [Thermodesulfovibrionales bacterium]